MLYEREKRYYKEAFYTFEKNVQKASLPVFLSPYPIYLSFDLFSTSLWPHSAL